MIETNEHRSLLRSIQKSIDEVKVSIEEIKSLTDRRRPEKCCNEARDKKGYLDPRLCGHWKDPHAIG